MIPPRALAALFSGALIAGTAAAAAVPPPEWRLVWSDEFNYTGAPDPAKWGYELGRLRNNEAQYYTDRADNVRVENGVLVLEARKETYSGAEYTSASIQTMSTDRQEVKLGVAVGRLEVRAKLPSVSGSWAAFWTLGADSWTADGGWPRSGEIDVFEYVAHTPYAVFGNLHYLGADGLHKDSVKDYNVLGADIHAAPVNEDFHVFRVDWHADRIEWYFDDVLYHQVSVVASATTGDPFGNPHYLILNLAVGGSWGSPISPDFVSDRYLVDYVRVFQLTTIPELATTPLWHGGLAAASALAMRRKRR